MKLMKSILSIITVTTLILVGLSTAVSATDTIASSAIPDDLIARKLKKHDPALALSVKSVRYKLKRNQPLTLVDVRRRQDFERLYIPGSINIPLHAVKTKTYLKSTPVVLVNAGFRYGDLTAECRRLAERGFQAFILDGGLPAWQHHGGPLAGDLFALGAMKKVSPRDFFRAKDYESTLVIDISPQRSAAAGRLMPYAQHHPLPDRPDSSKSDLRKIVKKKSQPFQSIILFDESGEQYEKAEKMMSRMGIEAFQLQGGVAAYQGYLEGLLLSWKSRESRMKTVGNCQPCGEKIGEEATPGSN